MLNAALIITFLLVGIYSWLSAVECGISLLRLLPKTTLTKQGLRMSTPLWGLSNVVLVCTFCALALFFNTRSLGIVRLVLPGLVVALSALLVRSIMVIYLFYGRAKTGFTWQNLFFAAVTFLVPLSFGMTVVRLLLKSVFWDSASGWTLIVSLLLGLLALAVTFVYFVVGHTPHDRLHQVSRWLNISLSLLVAVGLRLALSKNPGHLNGNTLVILEMVAVSVTIVQLVLSFGKRDRYMWWYISVFAVLIPLLLAIASRSYLLALR